MTDADEAVERLTAQLNHLMSLESVGVMVKTTDLAAVLARAARIKALEARVAELERRLSGGAGGTPPPEGPAYDPRPIRAYFEWSPPPAKMSGYRK